MHFLTASVSEPDLSPRVLSLTLGVKKIKFGASDAKLNGIAR
jgi:hypothetical protein